MAEKLPTRAENYADWYVELVRRAGLADYSPVRGCMIIKPYGFSIWETMQADLDRRFKATGHTNMYFPLLIPKSFLSREAQHVEGFAKECAVVTHHRLMNDPNGEGVVVDPEARLEEELIIRPTSETIIWDTYRDWIQSYRDLPLLYNQWANIVRWEMRTRLFLRTAEFLWQEGHTAHATREEAVEETEQMLQVYTDFCQDILAMPVIQGIKTASERFAGAEETYCIEALMQDGKALQAGTSHFLGQNFAKAFDVTYLTRENTREYVWATSWGVSTRLMGALVMMHSDDQGLILPPRVAPTQVLLVPIYRKEEEQEAVLTKIQEIAAALRAQDIRVQIDDDDSKRPGWKFAEGELKGVPLRLALGPKDLEKDQLEVVARTTGQKQYLPINQVVDQARDMLADIQQGLYQRALDRLKAHTVTVDTWADFTSRLDSTGGFLLAHWDGSPETEEKIKEETKATIRCIPLGDDWPTEPGKCVYSGNPSERRVLFARAY